MNTDGSKTMRVYCSSHKKCDFQKTEDKFKTKMDSNDKRILSSQASPSKENPEVKTSVHKGGLEHCTFAITFKLEERQDQWLLY